jgi:hypothetical protein
MIFGRKIQDDCQSKFLDIPFTGGVRLPNVVELNLTNIVTIANPLKGGDAKPWVYRPLFGPRQPGRRR